MLRSIASRVLPTRALASGSPKSKKLKGGKQRKTAAAAEVRLVPHLPPELVKETREFFQNSNRFKGILELVFSPTAPKDDEGDRKQFEQARNDYDTTALQMRQAYEAQEARAAHRMWRAVQQLPEDLYEEAVASKPEPVPESLLLRVRHRDEIFSDLNELERRKLQCFQNLMFVRYPHSEEKARNPQKFWIPENQVISRQKEAAMAKKKIKSRPK